jgi:hypothetical protein
MLVRSALVLLLVATSCAAPSSPSSPPPTAVEPDVAQILERQTQALIDAVTAGDPAVWDRYTAPELIYAAEDGAVKTKADLLREIRPLPAHVSGTLRVTEFVARPHGTTVVTSYVVDERETYYDQAIRARYRQTDTWLRTPTGWRLIAAQILALRDDPPSIALPAAQLDEYVGTYAITPDVVYTIRRDGDGLVGQRTHRDPEPLRVEVADVLFVPGRPRIRVIMQRGPDRRITGFVERRETWDIRWTRR